MMKKQTRSILTMSRLGLLALALVALVLGGTARVGSAQTGSGSPPPTYDWDDTLPGVQGPTSPLLVGPESRGLRILNVSIPVLVPLAELQAALPPGFNATATPAGSNTAQVTLGFILQQRSTRTADGQTFGPASGLQFNTTVINTNLTPNRQETSILGLEFADQELVDYNNALFGPGTARLAKVNAQLAEDAGNLSFKATVTDDGIGLNVSAEVTCPGPIVTRSKVDPGALPLRFLIPQRAFFNANQSDQRVVPQAMANVKVEAPDGKLRVPVAGGVGRSLTISGIGANITFGRNLEIVIKLE